MEHETYKATECGFTKGGLRVMAITDVAGSQVVITDDQSPDGTHLLSKPLENHKTCVTLGHKIQRHGTDYYGEWDGPLGVFEVVCLCAKN